MALSIFLYFRIPTKKSVATVGYMGQSYILTSWNSYSSLINNCVNDFDAKVSGGLIVGAMKEEEIRSPKHFLRWQPFFVASPILSRPRAYPVYLPLVCVGGWKHQEIDFQS